MPTTKRVKEITSPSTKQRKAEKEYSYYEYLQKFRHEPAPEGGRREGDEPFDCLTKLAQSKIREGLEISPQRTPRK